MIWFWLLIQFFHFFSHLNSRKNIKERQAKKLHFKNFFNEAVVQYKSHTEENNIEWHMLCHAKYKGALACRYGSLAHLDQICQKSGISGSNRKLWEVTSGNIKQAGNWRNSYGWQLGRGFNKKKSINQCSILPSSDQRPIRNSMEGKSMNDTKNYGIFPDPSIWYMSSEITSN